MNRIGLFLLATLLLSSCGPSPQDVEATLQAGISMTQTAMPTNTATPKPTNTPRPTPTAAPTPADIGDVVKAGPLEITVLSALERPSMHLGDISGRYMIYYTAPKGGLILDVTVLVRNTDSANAQKIAWSDINVREQNGDEWYPYWAKVGHAPTGAKFDAGNMGLSSDQINPADILELTEDTYLRIVYLVSDAPDQTLKFFIEDSPAIAFKAGKAP